VYLKILFGHRGHVMQLKKITDSDLFQARVHKDVILNLKNKTRYDTLSEEWVPFDHVE
jgi:hypothetical protein